MKEILEQLNKYKKEENLTDTEKAQINMAMAYIKEAIKLIERRKETYEPLKELTI